jgi:xanthine dehydrogenase accessory factor
MKNIYERLCDEIEKSRLLLATIVLTEGSSPQVPGASALFSDKGLLAGTLGGGIMEAKAEMKAMDYLRTGRSSLERFELYADTMSEEEAICGGVVTILFDARPGDHKSTFQTMVRSLSNRTAGVLATYIQWSGGNIKKITRSWIEKKYILGEEPKKQTMPFHKETKKAFLMGKTVFLASQDGEEEERWHVYLEPQFPLSHLVIAGAGHVGQAVAHLGHLLDFEVTVMDDRPEFANKDIVPEADHIIVGDVGKSIAQTPMTADTYFVIVTRGHSHDADALKACIGSEAAYIGMIGSERKVALMRKKFIDEGWAIPAQFDHVFAPIGIDIPSKTVQEIAISIAAQLIQVRGQAQERTMGKK